MYYQGNMINNECGCNNGCMPAMPTSTCCNQVVQTYNVQEVPHYQGIHTHVINNCIKKHINIPVYSQSAENVYIDEYAQGNPIYQQPVMINNQFNQQQPMMNPNQYQGNVGVDGVNQQMNPLWQMPNMINPFNN